MTPPKPPPGLAAPGRQLWRGVTRGWQLRADEMLVLATACRTAEDTARLEEALATAPLIVAGSMQQERAHPLLAEVRGMRALLAGLLRQLDLPDVHAAGVKEAGTSAKARRAAAARWDHRLGRARGA